MFIAATKLPEAVVDKQLKERTELTHSKIGAPQKESILAAGLALQQAGVVPASVDVKATVDALIDDRVLCLTALNAVAPGTVRVTALASRTRGQRGLYRPLAFRRRAMSLIQMTVAAGPRRRRT